MVWLTGGGLVICIAMVLGLVWLIVAEGLTTFWPLPVVQVSTVGGSSFMGEVTRRESYTLGYGSMAILSGPDSEAAGRVLNLLFHEALASELTNDSLTDTLAAYAAEAPPTILATLSAQPVVRDAPAVERQALLGRVETLFSDETQVATWIERLSGEIREAVAADEDGSALFALWRSKLEAGENWVALPEVAIMADSLDDADAAYGVWAGRIMSLASLKVSARMDRRLLRTGNFDLTGEHFSWVPDYVIVPETEHNPEWAIVIERLTWGRFYGTPRSFLLDGEAIATEPADVWAKFLEHHATVRERWQTRRDLEKDDIGDINHRNREAELALKRIELDYGQDSDEWQAAKAEYDALVSKLTEETERIREQINALDAENNRFQLVMQTAGTEELPGQEKPIALAEIVRAYPANQLSTADAWSIYGSRWVEFLTDDPREANSEGGVFPAIFGTVVMTMLLAVLVVPFGVLAALYLREYAKAGPLVSIIRIAVNNLAGVPSIVFGVFGLGFFCYIIGWNIDQLFFAERLPSPTYGTGGLFWASLTLALLTLPVVIVATEEALAAVPRSMREGSLACGATKWQTIWRIVLPRAAPGIMTGMILAMARGAGEVAPLMLVGAVKLAPELPIDQYFPYVHPERSFMHLGFHIYDLGFQSQNSEAAKPMVFTTTLLLIGLIALMNLMAIALRARLRAKFSHGVHV
jgi:phosphate transport system permease protein